MGMNKICFSIITLVSLVLMPACIGKCGSKPYKYDRKAEEAEILGMFNHIGDATAHNPEVPKHTTVVCPDNVEVKAGKASFICKVTYNNGDVQNYQIEIDNGFRSLKNAPE